MLFFVKLVSFVKTLQADNPHKRIYMPHFNNLLTHPAKLGASNISSDIANAYLRNYAKNEISCGAFSYLNPHINTLRNRSNLITLDDTDTELLSAMKTYRWYDEKRGTCLLDEWPEFENYYSAVGRQV